MKYLCLICAEKVMEQMPKADADKHYEEYREFTGNFAKAGILSIAIDYCHHPMRLQSACAKARYPARTGFCGNQRTAWGVIM